MRVALVTGGTRGIGQAIALALHEQGYRVAAVHHGNDEAARAFHARTAIEVFKWDVGDCAACADGVARVEHALGPVEVLVNNAGIVRDAPLHKMTAEQWHAVIATDLDSMFAMCRPLIEGMRERRFGRIVNIGSINGQKGQYGQANYAAAKAGVHGFTISLAQENARFGITVNTVSPGYVGTDLVMAVPEDIRAKIVAQIPVGRLGRPEEIAHAVAFLTSEDSSWITGSNLAINGGHYMGW